MTDAATQTPVAPDEAMLEALAYVEAAGAVWTTLAGGLDSTLGDFFRDAAWDLRKRVFGPWPDDADEFDRDPIEVQLTARCTEIQAEALGALGLGEREQELRREAQNIRNAGSISFPSNA